jgi:hypothetical protein
MFNTKMVHGTIKNVTLFNENIASFTHSLYSNKLKFTKKKEAVLSFWRTASYRQSLAVIL